MKDRHYKVVKVMDNTLVDATGYVRTARFCDKEGTPDVNGPYIEVQELSRAYVIMSFDLDPSVDFDASYMKKIDAHTNSLAYKEIQ